MYDRPCVPRASKFRTTSTSLAHGCSRESRRPDETGLLAIGKQENHVMRRARPARGRECAGRLEEHRRACRVVGGRGAGFHAVVVSRHEHGAPRLRARQTCEDILDLSHLAIAGPDAGGLLDRRTQAKRLELSGDVVAHAVVILRADRMRTLGDRAHVRHCTLGRELGRRRGSRHDRGRPRRADDGQRAENGDAYGGRHTDVQPRHGASAGS